MHTEKVGCDVCMGVLVFTGAVALTWKSSSCPRGDALGDASSTRRVLHLEYSGHMRSLGAPSSSNILVSWSISLVPGNSGFRSMSSPNMQPTALWQIQTHTRTHTQARRHTYTPHHTTPHTLARHVCLCYCFTTHAKSAYATAVHYYSIRELQIALPALSRVAQITYSVRSTYTHGLLVP